MAETETQLTHKLRNPKSYNEWMNIWTSHVWPDYTYEIYPSSDWKIPISQLTSNTVLENNNGQRVIFNETASLPSDITLPVNQIVNSDNTPAPTQDNPDPDTVIQKNVSIENPEGNHIAITNENGSISEGPAISSEGDAAKFLNEQGNWITVETDVPFSATIPENTTNVELAVGKDDNKHTITIEPQGKLSFEEGSSSNEIKLSLGQIETGDIKNNTIKLEDLDLTTLSDPSNPDSEKEFKLPAENMADIPVTQITNFDTAVNSAVNTNTKNNAGIVAAGKYNTSKAWLTDSEQNPGWAKVTADHMANELELDEKLKENSISGNKLNTKLLGAIIHTQKPILELTNDDLLAPENGYYGLTSAWQGYVISSTNPDLTLASEDHMITKWSRKFITLTKRRPEYYEDEEIDGRELGYYKTNYQRNTFLLHSAVRSLYYTIEWYDENQPYDTTKRIINAEYTIGFENEYNFPEYLVPSTDTLDEYFNRIEYFSASVYSLIDDAFSNYITNLANSGKTPAELSFIDFQAELDNIANSITSNYSDNWSQLVGIKNPDYSSNQLNEWDYEHCGIWIEI